MTICEACSMHKVMSDSAEPVTGVLLAFLVDRDISAFANSPIVAPAAEPLTRKSRESVSDSRAAPANPILYRYTGITDLLECETKEFASSAPTEESEKKESRIETPGQRELIQKAYSVHIREYHAREKLDRAKNTPLGNSPWDTTEPTECDHL